MKYKVRGPSGLVEVEAPEGATDEEIIALAQRSSPATIPTTQDKPSAYEPPKRKSAFDLALPEFITGDAGEAINRLGYRAGGSATDVASKLLPPEAAAGVGYGANLATQAGATMLGGMGGKAVEPLAQHQARNLMQSALKPNLQHDLLQGKAAKAIDYMLERGISVSEGGIKTLRSHIDKLRGEIGQLVANSTGTVDKNVVARELQSTLTDFLKIANPQNSLQTIAEAWQKFINHPLLIGKTSMPVQTAQEIKQGTHAMLSKSYGEMKWADIEAQKALARGLRQEIEKVIPGIKELNAKQGAAMDARLLTEIRLHGELNKDPGGLGFMIAAQNPQYALGWLAARSSYVKSLIAGAMYRGAPSMGAAAGAAYGSNVLGGEE